MRYLVSSLILLKSHFPYGSSRLVFACFLVSKSPSLSYSIFTTKSRTYFYDLKGHLPSQILSPTYRSSLPLHQCRRHSSVGNSVSSPKCAKEALQSSCYCGSGILWPLPHSPEQACAALNTGHTLHSLPGEILLPATLTPVPRSVLLMLQVFASS